MHQMTFSAHIAVADQLLAGGAGMPQAIVLDAARSPPPQRVGHSVGSQLGRAFDEVAVPGRAGPVPALPPLGGDDRGHGCRVRHVRRRRHAGRVRDGVAVVRFEEPDQLARSVATIEEKRAHFREVMATGAEQGARAGEIAERAAAHAEDAVARRIAPRVTA